MKKCLCLCICAVLFCGCTAMAEGTQKPWPTHAPEATPYIRLQGDAAPVLPEEPEIHESYEDYLRSIYAQEGKFYFIDWELEMFRQLPQDEPFRFTVHLEPMWYMDPRLPENTPEFAALLIDENTTQEEFLEKGRILGMFTQEYYQLQGDVNLEYAMKTARAFAEMGCETQVKCSKSVQNGFECSSYIAVVTATPARLFDLSGQMEDMYFIEQLYAIADSNHQEVCWSSAEDMP